MFPFLSFVLCVFLPTLILASPVSIRPTGQSSCQAGTEVINGRQCTYKCGVESPDSSYKIIISSSIKTCANACATDSACIYAQFYEFFSMCYMKKTSSAGSASDKVDAIVCAPPARIRASSSSTTTSSTATTTTPSKTTSTTSSSTTATTTSASTTTTASSSSTATTCPAPQQMANGRNCTVSCNFLEPGMFESIGTTGSLQGCVDACGGATRCLVARYNTTDTACWFKVSTLPGVYRDGIDKIECSAPASSTA